MCSVWESVWILVVTLSLVSCSSSPRRRSTLDGHVVIGVVLGFTTQTQHQCTEFFPLELCSPIMHLQSDCILWSSISSVANYCTLASRKLVNRGVVFTHPIVIEVNLKRSKWRTCFLICDFSSFHHNNFRDTISWECVEKDDFVRSCF